MKTEFESAAKSTLSEIALHRKPLKPDWQGFNTKQELTTELFLSGLCRNRGTVVRFHVKNPDRKWQAKSWPNGWRDRWMGNAALWNSYGEYCKEFSGYLHES